METSSSTISLSDVQIMLIQSEKEVEEAFINVQEMEEWKSFVWSNP